MPYPRTAILRLRAPLLLLATLLLNLTACTDPSKSTLHESANPLSSQPYSILRAGNRNAGPTGDHYYDSVQKVLGSRCAVCHSCTNGPCQLNMTSFDALRRGITAINPYQFGLEEKFSTRVSDNRPTEYWRSKGFRSVLPENADEPRDSIFFKAIELGEANQSAETGGPLTLPLARQLAKLHDSGQYSCPATANEYAEFQLKQPLGGMPWGLPATPESEHKILEDWVLAGSPAPSEAASSLLAQPEKTALTVGDPQEFIADWETFLNGASNESRLVARYIYEHSYQANLHFAENPGEFYRIVRSRSRPFEPIDRIATDGPMDDPGVKIVYYRLEKNDRIIEGKNHILWDLNLNSLANLKSLFFAEPWLASKLPNYASLNPFEVFEAIPAKFRSRFMIENSKMIYQSFARGPICMVQVSSYVADEYFWLWFMKPESDPSVLNPKLGLKDYRNFFTKAGNLGSGIPIIGDKYGEPLYREAFERTLRALKPNGLGLDDIWTGDGSNANAWLVYNRHQNGAEFTTTQDRALTGLPRSVWVVSYANFERMYYNGTVQYRYWGNVRHQNDSFNWQTYARGEAEDLYISLYQDQGLRDQLRNRYNTLKGKVYNRLFTDYAKGRPAKDRFEREDDLLRSVYSRMGRGVIGKEDRLNNWPYNLPHLAAPTQINSLNEFEAGMRSLTARPASFAQFVPNIVHLRLNGEHLYTLLANRGYKPDKISLIEAESRAPERDQLMAVPGFAGFESHLFIDLSWQDAAPFLRELGAIQDQAGWNLLHDRFAIARSSNKFWPFVDWLHRWLEGNMPLEAGVLELRFYDKNEKPF